MDLGDPQLEKAERRWRVVSAWKARPGCSFRGIAKQLGEHLSFCERWIGKYQKERAVEDAPRQGRKRKLDEDLLAKAKELGADKSTGTSRRVAARLHADCGVEVSPRTVRRNFSDAGLVWGGPKQRPLLTRLHKAKRLQWAQKHLRAKTSFAGWLFTDSKIFQVNRVKGKAAVKCWHPKGSKPIEAVGRSSPGIHIYMTVCKFGASAHLRVTGAGGKVSDFLDPKTGRPRAGVAAEEYVERVIPYLIESGNTLFQGSKRWANKWVLQQDGAPAHTARLSKEKLAACMPGRVVQDWPPGSPDLSWIENIWGWLEEQLKRSAHSIVTVQQLEEHISELVKSIPDKTYKKYVRGMRQRLRDVEKAEGDSIGK